RQARTVVEQSVGVGADVSARGRCRVSAETFLASEFPPQHELVAIERELKRLPRARSLVHILQAEIVWRLRRGEDVSVERMVAIWPIFGPPLVIRLVEQLRDWRVLSDAAPLLQLADPA
ncbi:MAG TPA: hypothetical protein VE861_04185, partial [Gemmatimonadaceae bacterium]|nr:hypothetical protein [Gemmatimonadaceae bacterium]